MSDTTPDLFALGQDYLGRYLSEFASYGILANPDLELRRGTGILCYYDFKDGQIYLSVPDLAEPAGKLHLLFLRSVLRAETNDDLLRFLGLFIPQIIAHELAHHFRHRYGLFTPNLWHEEQVANQLALAVTKHRLSPEDREYARQFLRRSIEGLVEKIGPQTAGTDSYYNILYALNSSGQIADSTVETIELVQRLFALNPEQILKQSGQISNELIHRLEQRDDIIDEINETYASDYMRYMYYQVEWLYLSLSSRETYYVDEFVRLHLNRRIDLLPIVQTESSPSDEAIQACFKAYQDTQQISMAGSRYFYKRYRALLLTKLQSVELAISLQTENLRKQAALLLESWSERESDVLTYLAELAPPSLRILFPHVISEHIDPKLAMQIHLPSETDRRLWKHIVLKESDESANNTLYRLALLDKTDIYRPLPAEVFLQLIENLCLIKLAAGEIIIWEGQINDDVFILIKGVLDVFVTQNNRLKRVGTIKSGEIFGEMAFFTNEPRNATVRATEASECFVLKDSDLKLLAFKYPSILMQMAGVLAKRIADLNKT